MRTIVLAFVITLFSISQLAADDLFEQRLNKGLRNAELFSYYLIEKGHNEPDKIMGYLEEAKRYSPDLPAVYFHLAWVTFTTSPTNIYDSLNYFFEGFSAYKRNFWWGFNLTWLFYIGILLAFFCTSLVVVLVRLPIDMPVINHEIKEDNKIFFVFLLVLFLSALGPLYFLAAMFMIISLYFKKTDIWTAYVFFGVLILLPLLMRPVEAFLSAEMSPQLKAIVSANEGKDNSYALSVLNNAQEKEEIFSHALALKREGMIEEAIARYEMILDRFSGEPIVYNNLGNCYAILKQYEKAREMYEKALTTERRASTLYNLSQVSRELLYFESGDRYFDEANKIDSDAVARYREESSRDPNRYYIDESLGKNHLWKYALRHVRGNAISITFAPKWLAPGIGIMILAAFIIFSRARKNRAFSCKRCGVIICPKCERSLKWGSMCNDCFATLVTFEKEPKDRIAKIMTLYDTKKRKKIIIRLLSFLIPGAHLIYSGKIAKGVVLTFFFILPPLLIATSLLFRISIYPYIHSWLVFTLIFTMAIIYIVNIVATRRFLKKWV